MRTALQIDWQLAHARTPCPLGVTIHPLIGIPSLPCPFPNCRVLHPSLQFSYLPTLLLDPFLCCDTDFCLRFKILQRFRPVLLFVPLCPPSRLPSHIGSRTSSVLFEGQGCRNRTGWSIGFYSSQRAAGARPPLIPIQRLPPDALLRSSGRWIASFGPPLPPFTCFGVSLHSPPLFPGSPLELRARSTDGLFPSCGQTTPLALPTGWLLRFSLCFALSLFPFYYSKNRGQALFADRCFSPPHRGHSFVRGPNDLF